MHPKKSLGQNFLMHRRIAERIAHTAELSKDTLILEIGPGTGMLTRALLEEGRRVLAIEADAELLTTLEETFAAELATGQLKLLHQDIRSFDTATISEPYKLVANIPYYITGEILRQFLTAHKKPISMTVLVQKEVAIRIARSKKESLLSLSVKAFGIPSYAFTVPRGAFFPSPNVDSAVLQIKNIQQNAFSSSEEEKRFFRVLKAGFAHKRKLLAGNLSVLASGEEIQSALASAGIPPKARAEEIPLSSWRILAEVMRF